MRVVGGFLFKFSCLDNYLAPMFNSHYSFKPNTARGPSKLRSNPFQTPDNFFPTFEVVNFHSLLQTLFEFELPLISTPAYRLGCYQTYFDIKNIKCTNPF